MKILYTNFHPRNGGGHASYVVNLARSFQGAHEVTVATPGTSRLFAQASLIPGVRCVDASFSTRLGAMMTEVAALRRLLQDGQFDLVHVNGTADHRQVMLARLGLRHPPRIVWTKHNTKPVRSIGHGLRARLGTDGAIGVCDYVTRLLQHSAYGKHPVLTIRLGVDTDNFQPATVDEVQQARKAFLGDIPQGTLVLGSVGGTDRAKGWMTLVQALACLPQAERDRFRLLVAGDPPRGTLRQEVEALGMAPWVVFPVWCLNLVVCWLPAISVLWCLLKKRVLMPPASPWRWVCPRWYRMQAACLNWCATTWMDGSCPRAMSRQHSPG